MMEARLEQTELFITLGESHVARQRDSIRRLAGLRLDTLDAEQLLASFERSQRAYIAYRDMLLRLVRRPVVER